MLLNLTELRIKEICYNFPVIYGFGKCCLFIDAEYFNNLKLPFEACNIKSLKYGYIVPDALFYYANWDEEIPDGVYYSLLNNYSSDCLLTIRPLLKLNNFKVLSSKWPLTPNSFTEANIYEFILDDTSINCSEYIILNQIFGKNLYETSRHLPFYFDESLIFDMIYANACIIKYKNFILLDIHDDNIMISPINEPRIFNINNIYYCFETAQTLIYIDIQVTKTLSYSLSPFPLRYLNTIADKYFPVSLINILTLLKSTTPSLDYFMTKQLPDIYHQYIISEIKVKQILIKYPNIKIAHY